MLRTGWCLVTYLMSSFRLSGVTLANHQIYFLERTPRVVVSSDVNSDCLFLLIIILCPSDVAQYNTRRLLDVDKSQHSLSCFALHLTLYVGRIKCRLLHITTSALLPVVQSWGCESVVTTASSRLCLVTCIVITC